MPTSEDRSRPRTDDEALAAVLTRARSLQRRRVRIASSAVVVLLVFATAAIAGGIGRQRPPDEQVVAGLGEDASTTTSTLAEEAPTTTAPAPPPSSTTVPPPTTSTSAPRPNWATGRYPTGGGPSREPLRLTLHLEARSVRAGEQLRGELVVENTSSSDYRYETGGCGGSWGFYRDGEGQGPAYACSTDIRYETLAAGEVRRRPFSVAADSDDGTPLAPGTYDFFASFSANGSNFAPPIAVEVT